MEYVRPGAARQRDKHRCVVPAACQRCPVNERARQYEIVCAGCARLCRQYREPVGGVRGTLRGVVRPAEADNRHVVSSAACAERRYATFQALAAGSSTRCLEQGARSERSGFAILGFRLTVRISPDGGRQTAGFRAWNLLRHLPWASTRDLEQCFSALVALAVSTTILGTLRSGPCHVSRKARSAPARTCTDSPVPCSRAASVDRGTSPSRAARPRTESASACAL